MCRAGGLGDGTSIAFLSAESGAFSLGVRSDVRIEGVCALPCVKHNACPMDPSGADAAYAFCLAVVLIAGFHGFVIASRQTIRMP